MSFDHIAKVLDGQHRLEGLRALQAGAVFQLNVTIFVEADIADQANIFATVNLAQTKVNKSLVYDLFDYAKSRSPQKTAHEVTVALDRAEGGPLHKRIKRLGTRTAGRTSETLTQATVVNCLLDLISEKPMTDRDVLMRGKKLRLATDSELKSRPFRNLFIEERDVEIAKIINNYFSAIRQKWPTAWEDRAPGNILARTNGFRAFMRAFRNLYVEMCGNAEIGKVFGVASFTKRLSSVTLKDDDFNTDTFLPGTSGETALYNRLINDFE
jgi:DGQHR domain-containing protein